VPVTGLCEKERGILEAVLAHLSELVRFRELLWNLVVRDLKVRYKNSVLGILWSWLNPLFMMVVYTVVFTVMRRSTNGSISDRHYPIVVLSALLPWNFFAASVAQSIGCIVENANLVKKVYFPREILPLAVVVANLINFAISLLVLFPMLLAFRVRLTPWVLFVPVVTAIQLCFVAGVCLLLSTLHVFYRDARAVMDVALMAWLFVTPVFYPIDVLPRSQEILGFTVDIHRWTRILNPMASVIATYQDVLYYGRPVGLDFLARTAVTALAILILGYAVFYRYSRRFGEEI
jgi:ABC-type polysaccharide/polyol phosphate export permease